MSNGVSPLYNTPVCRGCGYLLKAEQGCAICLGVKKCLVWPSTRTEESGIETAADNAQRLAKMLNREMRKLERLLKSEETYNSDYLRDLKVLSERLDATTNTLLKLEKQAAVNYGNLSAPDKIRIIANEFFAQLPHEYQRDFLVLLTNIVDVQSRSLLGTGGLDSEAELVE